jgi:hypothetical protein
VLFSFVALLNLEGRVRYVRVKMSVSIGLVFCVYFDWQTVNNIFHKLTAIDFETPQGFQKRLEIREKFFF